MAEPAIWLPGVLALAGVALTVAGGIVGAVLVFLVNMRAAAAATANAQAAAATSQATSENSLIDQLQEELSRYREAADARATAQDARMTRLDGLVDGYRGYAHQLRAHIMSELPPPPPDWPAHLPQ